MLILSVTFSHTQHGAHWVGSDGRVKQLPTQTADSGSFITATWPWKQVTSMLILANLYNSSQPCDKRRWIWPELWAQDWFDLSVVGWLYFCFTPQLANMRDTLCFSRASIHQALKTHLKREKLGCSRLIKEQRDHCLIVHPILFFVRVNLWMGESRPPPALKVV